MSKALEARIKELEAERDIVHHGNKLQATKIDELTARLRDSEDDWKRIQDAERRCEHLADRLKLANELAEVAARLGKSLVLGNREDIIKSNIELSKKLCQWLEGAGVT